MSWQATAWAIEQQEVTDPITRLVLLCLANYADAVGADAYPAIERLMRDTCLSESTVRRHLGALVKASMIRKGNQAVAAAKIGRADRRPIVYDLIMERGVTQTPREPDRGVSVTPRDGTGCQKRGNGVSQSPLRGVTAMTPDPPSRSSLNIRGESARAIPAGSCAESQNPEVSRERRDEFKRQLRVLARSPLSARSKS